MTQQVEFESDYALVITQSLDIERVLIGHRRIGPGDWAESIHIALITISLLSDAYKYYCPLFLLSKSVRSANRGKQRFVSRLKPRLPLHSSTWHAALQLHVATILQGLCRPFSGSRTDPAPLSALRPANRQSGAFSNWSLAMSIFQINIVANEKSDTVAPNSPC